MISLEKIENAYRITFKLVNETAFRIGSGDTPIDPSMPDNMIVRVRMKNKEIPYIPGSSLKGVFRAALESISNEKCGYENEKPNKENKEKFLKALENEKSTLCRVHKLFGNQFISGRLFFSDAYPEGEVFTRVRDGVMIDRDTETAAEGKKYDFEVVEPGATFEVEIIAINVDEKDLEAIESIVRLVDLGVIKIGGMKSRGLG